VFILTEATPNPEALKFLPHVRLTDGTTFAARRTEVVADASALADRLFLLSDVSAVFIAEDFLTVTRSRDGRPWSSLRLPVIAAVADHIESGQAAVAHPANDAPSSAGDDIEEEIRQVLALWVRPGVARDGGDVLFERFDAASGVLFVRMRGACGGCPSSRLTLKAGIERIVRRYVPEVSSVEEIAEPSPATLDWRKRLGSASAAGPRNRPIFSLGGRVSSRRDQKAS